MGVCTVSCDGGVQADVAALMASAPATLVADQLPMKKRDLTCEVWYPAEHSWWRSLWSSTTYTMHFGSVADPRRPLVRAAQLGRALRDAPPRMPEPREDRHRLSPILLISHGLYGHRLTMISLAERLSSHGFVVLACDHPGSTNADASLGATLAFWHHPLDVRSLLAEIERLGAGGSGGPLECVCMRDMRTHMGNGYAVGGGPLECVCMREMRTHMGSGYAVASVCHPLRLEMVYAVVPLPLPPRGRFLRGMADFSCVAVLGHSMGAYAALCVAGMTPTLHRGVNGVVPTVWQTQWDEVLKARVPQL